MSPRTRDVTTIVQAGVFGDWTAPITDGLRQVPTPVGELCVYCVEAIEQGDHGAIMAIGPHHKECAYREVIGGIGHYVSHDRYCLGELGTDAGLTRRQSALLVWRHLIVRRPVGEAELEALR